MLKTLQLLPEIFLYSIAVIGYLFFDWRRLKEDYTSNIIFSSGFIIVLVTISSSLLASLFYKQAGIVFWSGVAGFIISFIYAMKRYKLRGVETFEAAGIGLLTVLFANSLVFFMSNANMVSAISLLLPLVIFGIFVFLDGRYKRFTWYRSGRVGFAGLISLVVYFLMRCFIVVLAPVSMISFSEFIYSGKIDILFSGTAAIGLLFYSYWLAKSK